MGMVVQMMDGHHAPPHHPLPPLWPLCLQEDQCSLHCGTGVGSHRVRGAVLNSSASRWRPNCTSGLSSKAGLSPECSGCPWAIAPSPNHHPLPQATSALALAVKGWQGPDWKLMPQLGPSLQALSRALGEGFGDCSDNLPAALPPAVCSAQLSLTFLICRVEVGFIARMLRVQMEPFIKCLAWCRCLTNGNY